MFVCTYVCPSNFASEARTAGPIGTGETSFDTPERRKDAGAGCGLIGCTWHVPRRTAQALAKKLLTGAAADPPNGRIRLKLSGMIANTGGPVRLGEGVSDDGGALFTLVRGT